MAQLDIPADIVMDEVVIYDKVNDVISFNKLVFDAAAGMFVQRVFTQMPDGSIVRTDIRPRGKVAGLVGLLRSTEPAKVDVKLPGQQMPVSIVMQLDPNNLERFFFRAGNRLVGTGKRVSEYCPWCVVAGVVAVGVIGLGAYGIYEGRDVEIGVQVDLERRTGNIGVKITRSEGDESG